MKKEILSIYAVAIAILFLINGCGSTGSEPNSQTNLYKVTISASPVEGGTVEPASGEHEEGASLDITANPSEGWRFDHWEGDYQGSSSSVTITIEQDMEITGVFVQKEYDLIVNIEGEGTVDEKVVEKAKEYKHGTIVELTANPVQGHKFVEWKGAVTGSENPVQVTMAGAKEVTAVFEKKDYTLNITVEGEGRVSEEAVKAKDYTYGTTVKLAAKPLSGWTFDHWEGDLTGSENLVTITVDGPKEVTAVFVDAFYLAENGVTIICSAADVGDSGTVNGVTYTKRTKSQITPANAASTCTSGITNMSLMFNANSFNGDISSWDVSRVTDMSNMFTASPFNGDISSWDVSNVTNMNRMFSQATSFNGDLSSWDVSNVTDMTRMFFSATSFNGDISNWCVTKITSEPAYFATYAAFEGDATKMPKWGTCPVK